jgi:hypothetical protein
MNCSAFPPAVNRLFWITHNHQSSLLHNHPAKVRYQSAELGFAIAFRKYPEIHQ